MNTVAWFEQFLQMRKKNGIGRRSKLWGIEFRAVNRREVASHERSLEQRQPRICKVLKRDQHIMPLSPRRRGKQHTVPLTSLQSQTAIALSARFPEQTQIGEPFVEHHRLTFGNRPPIKRTALDVAIGG